MSSNSSQAFSPSESGNARRLHIHQGVGDDGKLFVPARHIEMMHHVAQIIAIILHARLGLHRQLEREAALRTVRAGLHARLHQAFADVRAVAEFCQMADGIIQLGFDRGLHGISDIDFVNCGVDSGALLLDIGEKLGQIRDHFFERREHQPGA